MCASLCALCGGSTHGDYVYIYITYNVNNSILIFLFILFLIDSCRAVHRCVRAMLDVDGGVGTSVNSVAADGTEGVLSSVLYWRLYRFSSYLAFADIKNIFENNYK